LGVALRKAFFVVRRHANLTVEPQGEFGPEFETDTGWVSERRVWVCREGQRLLPARLVRVRLKQPTEDGDWEVEILTNLPARVKAVKVAWLYLKRWKIETGQPDYTSRRRWVARQPVVYHLCERAA